MARLHRVSDLETRQRLFTVLLALITDEELTNMVQRLSERDDLLLDTPFLRRIRAKGHEAGVEEGHEAGWAEGCTAGRAEGEKIGLQAGALLGRRRDLLDLLLLRFDPPASVYRQIEQQLETVTAEEQFRLLLATIIRAENVTDFQAVLQDIVSAQSQS